MKEILQTLQNRIAEIKEIRYIDENWGQLTYYESNMPVQFPCCLIDIGNIQYSNAGRDAKQQPQQRQIGRAGIRFTIADLKLTNTSLRAPQGQKDNAWAIWELLEQLHKKLHYFSPKTNVSPLIRLSTQHIMRDDGVQEYEIVYICEVQNV